MTDIMTNFCPACFASEDDGSWGHTVVNNYCTNCGNGSTVTLPQWAIRSIREQASWVGKRFYPHKEDIDNNEERERLFKLIKEFPNRSALKTSDGAYKVTQIINGYTISTNVKANSLDEAMKTPNLPYYTSDI